MPHSANGLHFRPTIERGVMQEHDAPALVVESGKVVQRIMAAANAETNLKNWILGMVGTGLVAAVGWMGSVVWTQNANVVRLQTQGEMIAATLTSIQAQLADGTRNRYTSDQAALDRAVFDRRILAAEEQIAKLREFVVQYNATHPGGKP